MNKTKFVSVEDTQKVKKETVFTHCYTSAAGWQTALSNPEKYSKVLYLGNDDDEGDMFAAYEDGYIVIFKGLKGDEFNQQ